MTMVSPTFPIMRARLSCGRCNATEAAVISTERLDLVPLTVEDADEMVTVLADEGLYEFTGGGRRRSPSCGIATRARSPARSGRTRPG